MKRFAALFTALDQTTRTTLKIGALAEYFRYAPETDRLWTVALFSGRRPRRAITGPRLRDWVAEAADIPLWLLEESYAVVGDPAESLALLLPPPTQDSDRSLTHWIDHIRTLADADEDMRKQAILAAWGSLPPEERLVFNKLLTGGFRLGVSQKLMTRALAQATGRDESELAHRLMGDWTPDNTTWAQLIEEDDPAAAASRPYPFCLAHGVNGPADTLGDRADWLAEWKWDGIRGQLIHRQSTLYL